MSVLSWGKPNVAFAPYTTLEVPTTGWALLPEIKQDTSQLNTEEGETKEALDEGGDIVDTKTAKSRYTFTCDVFIKKGDTVPIENEDGVVTTNYAFILVPEDTTTVGFKLEKTSVSVAEKWSSADGGLWTVTFKGIKPKTGKTLKRLADSDVKIVTDLLAQKEEE